MPHITLLVPVHEPALRIYLVAVPEIALQSRATIFVFANLQFLTGEIIANIHTGRVVVERKNWVNQFAYGDAQPCSLCGWKQTRVIPDNAVLTSCSRSRSSVSRRDRLHHGMGNLEAIVHAILHLWLACDTASHRTDHRASPCKSKDCPGCTADIGSRSGLVRAVRAQRCGRKIKTHAQLLFKMSILA